MITKEMLSNYKELQEKNNHGELLEAIASDLKLDRFEKVFHSVNTIQDVDGYLTHDLMQVRNRYKSYLKDYIMINLPEEDSNILMKFI